MNSPRVWTMTAMLGVGILIGTALSGSARAEGEPSDQPTAAPTQVAPVAVAPAPAAPDLAARVADLEAYINNTPPKLLTAAPGPGHNGWMMTSTALVLFMTLPGLALFYGGLVRRKNILSVIAQCSLAVVRRAAIRSWAR
jgi:Amt family ammonium transporter